MIQTLHLDPPFDRAFREGVLKIIYAEPTVEMECPHTLGKADVFCLCEKIGEAEINSIEKVFMDEQDDRFDLGKSGYSFVGMKDKWNVMRAEGTRMVKIRFLPTLVIRS